MMNFLLGGAGECAGVPVVVLLDCHLLLPTKERIGPTDVVAAAVPDHVSVASFVVRH